MTSIKDVARLAGVSTATVSRVIHGSNIVKLETKQAVLGAMKELNYQPNLAARMLAGGKSNFIGLIIPEFRDPTFSQTLTVTEAILRKHHYHILATVGHGNYDQEIIAIENLRARNIDGLILFTDLLSDQEMIELSQKIPLVALNRHIPSILPHCIWQESRIAIKALIKYLAKNHYRKANIITGPLHKFDGKERLEAVILNAQTYGIELNKIVEGDFSFAVSYQIMSNWIKQSDLPPLIMAANDEMALGAIRACQDYGIRYPEDILITGYDDTHHLEPMIMPVATTLRVPIREMAESAAHLIMNLAYNHNMPVLHQHIPKLITPR